MPVYSYAVISAFLWALSVPVLNSGISNTPREGRIHYIFLGLFSALLTGTLVLYLFVNEGASDIHINIHVVLAGIFTFPVATGLYYISAYAFGSRTELASQFAKVKPLFSIALAVVVLNEAIGFWSWVTAGITLLGLAVFSLGVVCGEFSPKAFMLGLLTALSWAAGEVFVKLGFSTEMALHDSFVALASSAMIFAIVMLPMLLKIKVDKIKTSWILPFMLHGLLSFGIAYTAFFKSITVIGVAKTAMINAFWPFLGILLTYASNRVRGREYKTPTYIWITAFLLFTGSIIQIVSLQR